MPEIFKLSDQNVKLVVWHATEPMEFFILHSGGDEKQLSRINDFKNGLRKLQWLASRFLLKYILEAAEFPELVYNEYGKPFLKNSSLHISISHTGKFVSVIISDNKTAIDIEVISPRIEKISSKFMHPSEFLMLDENTRTEQLFLHWSAKETMFKWSDENGIDFKNELQISPYKFKTQGILNAGIIRNHERVKLSVSYRILQDNLSDTALMLTYVA
jgi:4'-phosphopantetheinyl transferase